MRYDELLEMILIGLKDREHPKRLTKRDLDAVFKELSIVLGAPANLPIRIPQIGTFVKHQPKRITLPSRTIDGRELGKRRIVPAPRLGFKASAVMRFGKPDVVALNEPVAFSNGQV